MLQVVYKWPENIVLIVIISLGLSIVIGYLFYKCFWVTIGLTGLFSGYFLGSFVYAMILALTGWESEFMMSLLAGSAATIGCYSAFYYGNKLALVLTSLTGSYILTRGLSFIFGGFPSEFKLINWIKGGQSV